MHLSPEARTGLRTLHERLRGGSAPATSPTPPRPASPRPAESPVISPPPPAAKPAPAPVVTARLVITGTSREEQLASLRQQAETWGPAQSLGTLRDVMVFGTGDPNARLLLVGEAPGYEEEKQREPFVGPAGKKLDGILKAMDLSRADVYLTNIVKFRPAAARQTTNNRPPTAEETAACLALMRAEIDIVRPACIVALGPTAAAGLLGSSAGVATLRGSWHEFQGTPVRVTYHPSHLLRSEHDLPTKRSVWEDMLAVMERLALPISAKQRGHFLPRA